MNAIKLALLSGLVLLGNMARADQQPPITVQPQGTVGAALAPPSLSSGVFPGNLYASVENPNLVVTMAPFRIEWGAYPRYSAISSASLKPGLLEPCALVKVDVNAKRRWDFFLAPVALDNRAAGFAIARMSW
jgi:hypothetical protein